MTDDNTPNYPPSGQPNWQQQPNPYANNNWQQPQSPYSNNGWQQQPTQQPGGYSGNEWQQQQQPAYANNGWQQSQQQGGYQNPGWQQQPNAYAAAGWQQPMPPANQPSQKSFTITWILSLLVGYFGVDRFYLGKVGTGLLKLFTAGGAGIWYLIDLIMTLTGNATDKQGHKVVGTGREPMIAWVVSAVVIGVSLISSGVSTLNSASEIPAAVTSVSTPRSTPTQEATTAPEPEPVVETEEAVPAEPAETAGAVVEEESTGTVS